MFFGKQAAEKHTLVMRKIDGVYRPLLRHALARPAMTAAIALAIFVGP